MPENQCQKVSEYDQELPQLHNADQPRETVRKSYRTVTVTIHHEGI